MLRDIQYCESFVLWNFVGCCENFVLRVEIWCWDTSSVARVSCCEMLIYVAKMCCGWKFDVARVSCCEMMWMLRKFCVIGWNLMLRDIQCCAGFVLRNDVGVEKILYYWLRYIQCYENFVLWDVGCWEYFVLRVENWCCETSSVARVSCCEMMWVLRKFCVIRWNLMLRDNQCCESFVLWDVVGCWDNFVLRVEIWCWENPVESFVLWDVDKCLKKCVTDENLMLRDIQSCESFVFWDVVGC